MRIARLETADGPRYAIRAGEGWAVVEDCLADPPILTAVRSRAPTPGSWRRASPGCWSALPHQQDQQRPPAVYPGLAQVGAQRCRPDEGIQARRDVGTVNVEGELAVVIGRDTKGISVRPPSTTYRATRWSTP
jgi:hypothetical protein